METQKKTFKEFFAEKKEYFILLGTVFLLFTIMLAFGGCFPFGSKTLLVSDSNAQIGAFFEYLFKVFRGEASLFYTDLLGGGVEILSSIEYMLLSPFYLVCFLGGEQYCYQMFNIAILLMLLFNAFVFIWFSKKYFKNIKPVYRLLIGLLFTFSGFVLLTYSFVTWLIYPALLLLLIDGFKTLVYDGKILKFTLVLIWYVLNCFSIGVFTNLTLVVLFTLYTILIVPKQERKSVFTRLFVSYLVGILVCATVLFPSIYAMIKSSRGAFSFTYLKNTAEVFKLTNFTGLFIDGIFLIFWIINLVLLFKNERCSNKFKFKITTFCILISPLIFNISLNLLCGGIYSGFSNRFHFLMNVMLCIGTLELFDNNYAFQEVKSSPIFKILYCFMAVIFVLGILILEILKGDSLATNIKSPIFSNNSLPLFFLMITIAFVFLILFAVVFYKRKVLSSKFVKFNMVFVMVVSIVLNFLCYSQGGMADCKIKQEITNLTSSQTLSGRIKKFNLNSSEFSLLNTTVYGHQNLSFFSSLIVSETTNSFSKLGYYACITSVESNSESGTLLADCLTGQIYYISSFEEDRPYLTLVEKSENYFLYKNELTSTGAILFDNDYSYDNSKSVLENFEIMAKCFGVEEKLFYDANILWENINDKVEGVKSIKKLTYTAEQDCILYLNTASTKLEKEQEKNYGYENIYALSGISSNLYDFKFVRAGETITLTCFMTEDIEEEELQTKFLDYEVAKRFCEKLQENSLSFESNKNGYIVSGDASSGKKLIVFAPDIEGYEYTLNGEKIEINHSIGYFAEIEVSAGTIELVVTYRIPYLNWWIIVLILSLTLVVILACLYHFTKFKHMGRAFSWIFVIISCIILSIFYIFGIILSFFRI